MFWVRSVVGLVLAGVVLLPVSVGAAAAPALSVPVGLSIAEIKMTGNEFVMLENNTGADIANLSSYWLEYYNAADPLAANVSSSSMQLPMAPLKIGEIALLAAEGGPTCGAAMTAKLGFSLGDSAGYVQVVHLATDPSSGGLTQAVNDVVSWSSGTMGIIKSVPSASKNPAAAWYRYQAGANPLAYAWQLADVDAHNPCQLHVVASGTIGSPGNLPIANGLLPGAMPPATIVSVGQNGAAGPSIPERDRGLMAPVLNELLPNPASPQTDANDEFIELYNPNNTTFDLSGFVLQSASSTGKTKRSYAFPAGTMIEAKEFKAFYSSDISLSLSNSGGQVWLLDPLGNVISHTDAYGSAKDGQTWALANGVWYWTHTSTPDGANVVAGVSGNATNSKTTSGEVRGATADRPATSQQVAADASKRSEQSTPLHPLALALVAGGALLYGAYEYRHDLANKFHQLRANRSARRTNR